MNRSRHQPGAALRRSAAAGWSAVLRGCWFGVVLLWLGGGVPSLQASPKPILVHYLPWYVAKPYSASWGWHWTMNHYNPDLPEANGQRPIASWYHPLIGPYDSEDPAVLEYHVLLMKLAGIDGVIVDWYGPDEFADYAVIDRRTQALLVFTRKAGLSFTLCYEDQTVRHEIDAGWIRADAALAQGRKAMLHAEGHYFSDPTYLRWQGRPVLLNFGPQYFKDGGDWPALFSGLRATNQPALFTLDRRLASGEGAFGWPPMALSQASGGVLSPDALESYLEGFERQAAGPPAWPAVISSAFPGFRDIYQEAGVGASYGYLDDRGGETFLGTLARALTNAAAWVQIVTWNDFGEGTIVEPTRERGYRDLETIQDARREHVDPGFPARGSDLRLAVRLFDLRRQTVDDPVMAAELDRVFEHAAGGRLEVADRQLAGAESRRPVLYDVALGNGRLSFTVGGQVTARGFEVLSSADPGASDWRPVGTIAGSVERMRFSAEVGILDRPVFLRVRESRP